MKFIFKSMAIFAALALGQSAMAGTVYISGSTAFRTAAMHFLFTSGSVFDAVPIEKFIGSSQFGATYADFIGNEAVTHNPLVVKVSWTGSAGGLALVANQASASATFLNDSFDVGGSTGQVDSTESVPTGANATTHSVDIAFSDVFQGSATAAGANKPGISGADSVAIVPFKWVGSYDLRKNSAGGTAITNITSQNARALYSESFITSAAQLTASQASADKSIFVFPMGRDFDSGTRITAFIDAGISASASPGQWQPFVTGVTNKWVGFPSANDTAAATDTAVTHLRQWNDTPNVDANGKPTSDTDLTISYTFGTPYKLYGILNVGSGNGGFQSGGNLAKLLRMDTNTNLPGDYNGTSTNATGIRDNYVGGGLNCTGAYMISYLGTSDANTLLSPQTQVSLTGAVFTSGSKTVAVPWSGGVSQLSGIITRGCPVTTGTVAGHGIDPNITNVITNIVIGTVATGDTITLAFSATDSTTNTITAGNLTSAFGSGFGTELSYNGVFYSPDNIYIGAYSMWGYEHLYYNSLSTQGTGVKNHLKTAFAASTDPSLFGSGLQLATMQCARGQDGGVISGTYY